MTYHFFFERKKLVLLFSLLGLGGIVLFVAGVLVGLRMNQSGVEPSLDVGAGAAAIKKDLSNFEKEISKSPPSADSEPAGSTPAKSESGKAPAPKDDDGADKTPSAEGSKTSDLGGSLTPVAAATKAKTPAAEAPKRRVPKPANQDRSVAQAAAQMPIKPPDLSPAAELGVRSSMPEPPEEASSAETKTAVATSPTAAPRVRGAREVFELQLSQVRSLAEADREVGRWKSVGLNPYVVVVRNIRGERRYTVRVGPFSSRQEALGTQEQLARGEGHQSTLKSRRTSRSVGSSADSIPPA